MKTIILMASLVIFFLTLFSTQQNFVFGQTQTISDSKQVEQTSIAVPEPSEKAIAYYNSGIILWILNIILGLLIPFLFLQTRLSTGIRNFARKFSSKWFFIVTIYFVIFLFINYLIGLPLDFYQGFMRQHEYGLSNQDFFRWLSNSLIEQFLTLIVGSLLLWLPYLIIRRSPHRWWFYTSLLLVPFYCFTLLITPIFIDPLFNNFGAMKNKELEEQILTLANRAGIEGSRVYEVDKSADTKTVNAYVTGFMSTKRIVLWDTIISKLDKDELLFVMAHEMGHYVLGHVWKGLILLSIITFLMLFLVYKISNYLTKQFGDDWGFCDLTDPAAMPLLLLVGGVLSLIISPLGLWYSRYSEHEADRFAIEITRNNYSCATAFIKLQTENLSNPRPSEFIKILRSSHPTIGERIDFCNSYKPWEKGEPLKYSDLFVKLIANILSHVIISNISILNPIY